MQLHGVQFGRKTFHPYERQRLQRHEHMDIQFQSPCIEQMLSETQNASSGAAVILIDLDGFSHLNHALGYAAGDMVADQVMERLRHVHVSTACLKRFNGNRFMILIPGIQNPQEVEKVVQGLRGAFQVPFKASTCDIFLTASMGISMFPKDGIDLETLERNADLAMYAVKKNGGNHFCFFTPDMQRNASRYFEIMNSMYRSMELNELMLLYQPQIDNRTGRMFGVEALLRWNHPRLGFLSPETFIHIAEESGQIVPIGRWVLNQACRQIVDWIKMGFGPFRVAVNVSARQFAEPNFVNVVSQALQDTQLEPHLLELELTEGMLLENLDLVASRLDDLRRLGISISIDDFGVGYSSLSYFRSLPVDRLKIDRTFIHDLIREPVSRQRSLALIMAILNMADGLHLSVVAEGVEEERQKIDLSSIGCNHMQGYLFSRPLHSDQLTRYLGIGHNQATYRFNCA
jgi:diguanylate cyclase (GGDEF)-like protein